MRSSKGGGPKVFGLDVRKWGARFVINVVAIYVAVQLVDGIWFDDVPGILLAGAIFGLVNSFVRPIVKRLTCPMYVLTLGAFAFVVNAIMLVLTSWIAEQAKIGFHVEGFVAPLLGGVVTGVVSFLVSLVL